MEKNESSEIRAALLQYQIIQDIVTSHLESGDRLFHLTPDIVLFLHSAGTPAHELETAAKLRTIEVRIEKSEHVPPKSSEILPLLLDMCEQVNSRWDTDDIVYLPAYVLWRLNWIHPFEDRNGRTARALSYMLLCLKSGGMLPGHRTIPELLREHRSEYYNALRDADEAFNISGEVNVSQLQMLLSDLLVMQLEGFAALSEFSEQRIREIVIRRLGQADPAILKSVFGNGELSSRHWALEDYVVVQVGTSKDIKKCNSLNQRLGNPFPGLFSGTSGPNTAELKTRNSGKIFRGNILLGEGECAFILDPGVTLIVEKPCIVIENLEANERSTWSINGALYVLRLPAGATDGRIVEALDVLSARHIADLERRDANA